MALVGLRKCACLCACVCVFVHMCVCERERERDGKMMTDKGPVPRSKKKVTF